MTSQEAAAVVLQAHDDGVILAAAMYRQDVFGRKLKLKKEAMASVRRGGLPARRMGRQNIILGDEAIEWARSLPKV